MRVRINIDRMTAWLLMAILFITGACNDTGIPVGFSVSEVEMKLSVDATALNQPFNAEGGSKTITVNSTNVDWAITSLPSWITMSSQTGSSSESINLEAERYYDVENGRIGFIHVESTVSGFDWSGDYSVSQNRALKYARPKNSDLVFNGGGGTKTVEIDANCDYDMAVAVGRDWLSASKGDGAIIVSVTGNNGQFARNGRIDINTPDESGFNIVVSQRVANVDVSTTPLTFTCEGGSYQIKVKSEVDWQVNYSEPWLEVTSQKGGVLSDTCFTITALPNQTSIDRNGFVYIWTGSQLRAEIPIVQEGFYFRIINENSKAFNDIVFYQKMSLPFKIETNASWYVDADSVPEWVELDPLSGKGDTDATVGVKEIYDTLDRSTEVKYIADVIQASKFLKVGQKGRYFKAKNNVCNVNSKPQSWRVSFSTNDDWSVRLRPQVDWVNISDSSVLFKEFTVNVSDNPSLNSRQVHLDICPAYSSDTATIQIIQAGRYLDVDVETVTFFTKGGMNGINVNTDGTVKAEVERGADWLSVMGVGTGTYILTAKQNDGDTIRTGRVAFRLTDLTEGELVRYVSVTQSFTDFVFIKEGYSEDSNYDLGKTGDFTITVTGYTDDLNLNGLIGIGEGSTLTVTQYPDEKDVNDGKTVTGDVDVTDYPDDTPLDE